MKTMFVSMLLALSGLLLVTCKSVPQAETETREATEAETAEAGPDAVNGMILLPGGSFTMGSPLSAPFREDDETPHEVTVSAFWIGQYEVTQKEYEELMGENPSETRGENLPAGNVTWYDAVNYCNARSLKEGLAPAYTVEGESVTWNRNAPGYRLPTEAEWEYACRAGTVTAYNWGDSITPDDANYESDEGARPVGSYLPNAWGLYDMHGNADEWCWDRYGDYPEGRADNPAGPETGATRVIRSGPWNGYAPALRSADRLDLSPQTRNRTVGFRTARNAEGVHYNPEKVE